MNFNARSHSPFVLRQMLEFCYVAPMLFRYQCHENLRKIHERNEKRKRNHQKKENFLVSTKFTDVRQHIVKIHIRANRIPRLIFSKSACIFQPSQHNIGKCTVPISRTFIFKCCILVTTATVNFRFRIRCNGHNNIGCWSHCFLFCSFFQTKIEFFQTKTGNFLSLLFREILRNNFIKVVASLNIVK